MKDTLFLLIKCKLPFHCYLSVQGSHRPWNPLNSLELQNSFQGLEKPWIWKNILNTLEKWILSLLLKCIVAHFIKIFRKIYNIFLVIITILLKRQNKGEKYIWTIKESFNCKTLMPGTVKCRPTVAYWVQIDGINIATELITRYYLNGTLIQCCFNARPTSATLAQHWINVQCLRESPENTRHLYNIYTTSAQRLRRWSNIA